MTADLKPIPSDRSDRTRERILVTAADLFAKFGFARTRMDDIATRAGVSRGLVHSYFGTKPKLLRAVQEFAIVEWSDSVAKLIEEAPGPSAALEMWVRTSLSDTTRHPLLRALYSDDALAASPDWEQSVTRTRGEWLARLAGLIELGIARGEFRADLDIEASALAIRTLQVGLIGEILSDPPRSSLPRDRQIGAAIDLMLAGLRTAAP